MEEHLKDDAAQPLDQKPPIIDPLRRVFVPKEAKTSKGTVVFRTLDFQVYARLPDGSIRRSKPKVNGKAARKARARSRHAGRTEDCRER